MAEAEAEQADLARMPGGLLINFGTVDALDGMLAAGSHANQNGKPVVFDPVGVGATSFRRATAASERFFLRVWFSVCLRRVGGSQNCSTRGSRR
jgi:hydroxyethylthiazole kinase-like sugar kinase family protein